MKTGPYQIPAEEKTVEQCRSHGEDHRAYGWSSCIDPQWSPEQLAAYWQGYYGDAWKRHMCPECEHHATLEPAQERLYCTRCAWSEEQ